MNDASPAFQELVEIVRKLRAPDGCPWDRKQTPRSLRSHLLEEVYETIEAIDLDDHPHIQEEIGDVFLLLVMLGVIFEEQEVFTVADSVETICAKLVRRHPHVFGDSTVNSADEVVEQWNRIKVEEEGKRIKDLHLDSVSNALPPLERAHKLQKKAAQVGFDWPDFDGVLAKLSEEMAEVRSEVETEPASPAAIEEEVGDLLFSAVNAARYLGVDPSIALDRANRKFFERFSTVESKLKKRGQSLEAASLSEMDDIWNTLR